MRDPLEELKDLSAAGPALPAEEVRRRGDRMRRRRTALQAVGAAVAVAAIASGGAVMTGSLTSSTPPAGPATPSQSAPPSATPTVSAEVIPTGFPLDAGIAAAPGVDSTDLAVDDATGQSWWALPCEAEPAGPGAEQRAAARRVWVEGDFWSRSRQLVVYQDLAAADRAFAGLEETLAACAETDQAPPGAEPLAWELASFTPDGGEGPWLIARGSSTADGSHANHVELVVTQVGRAVVVSRRNQSGAIEPAQSLEPSHGTVVDAMCLWSASGCSTSTSGPQQPRQAPEPEPQGGWRTEVPGDVVDAVRATLPTSGGDVPGAVEDSSPDLPWRGLPCGDRGDGEYAEPLTSTWLAGLDGRRTDQRFVSVSPPASFQARQLVVYESGEVAADVLTAIGQRAEQCPPEPDPDLPTELRWAADPFELDGAEGLLLSGGSFVEDTDDRTIGRTLVTVVRRGNAVLTAVLSDESSAPLDALDDPGSRALLDASTHLADRMCVFSSDGCGG